jgi:hypothetical protein
LDLVHSFDFFFLRLLFEIVWIKWGLDWFTLYTTHTVIFRRLSEFCFFRTHMTLRGTGAEQRRFDKSCFLFNCQSVLFRIWALLCIKSW